MAKHARNIEIFWAFCFFKDDCFARACAEAKTINPRALQEIPFFSRWLRCLNNVSKCFFTELRGRQEEGKIFAFFSRKRGKMLWKLYQIFSKLRNFWSTLLQNNRFYARPSAALTKILEWRSAARKETPKFLHFFGEKSASKIVPITWRWKN